MSTERRDVPAPTQNQRADKPTSDKPPRPERRDEPRPKHTDPRP
jgi:hypothetical protein